MRNKVCVGVIGAMSCELRRITSIMRRKREKTVAGASFVTGYIGNLKIVVGISGVGKAFAAACTQQMISTFRPRCIVNVGVAGSLNPEICVMDVVVSTGFVQWDIDTSAVGDPCGMVSGINKVLFDCDEGLREKLKTVIGRLDIKLKEGMVASGDCFVASDEKKEEIAQKFNASVADMECASIGQICYINRVPYASIKFVSDNCKSGEQELYEDYLKYEYQNTIEKIAKEISECKELLSC